MQARMIRNIDLSKSPSVEPVKGRVMPSCLQSLLLEAENFRALYEQLTAIRAEFGFTMRPEGLQTLLGYATEAGFYWDVGEGVTAIPVTESFRRHILVGNYASGSFSKEVKIPGDHGRKRVVFPHGFTLGRDYRAAYSNTPILAQTMVNPEAFVVQPDGDYQAYGETVHFPHDSGTNFHCVVYDFDPNSFVRVGNLTHGDIDQLAGRYAKYQGKSVAVAQSISKQLIQIILQSHFLGIGGIAPGGNDLHTENFRVILDEDDFRIVHVSDLESYNEIRLDTDPEVRAGQVERDIRNFVLGGHVTHLVGKTTLSELGVFDPDGCLEYYDERRIALRPEFELAQIVTQSLHAESKVALADKSRKGDKGFRLTQFKRERELRNRLTIQGQMLVD